jgi:hypothetical protein
MGNKGLDHYATKSDLNIANGDVNMTKLNLDRDNDLRLQSSGHDC